MFSKKDIDSFILREASKYLFEEEQFDLASLEKNIEDVNSNLKNAQNDLKNKLKELTTQKNMVSSIQGSGTKASLQKKQATLGVQIKEEEIEQAKAAISALESQLSQLESQKNTFQEKEKEVVEEEIVSQVKNIQSPQKVEPTQKTQITQKVQPVQKANTLKANEDKGKKKDVLVRFDTKTNSPFVVKFTDRGFLVGDTRLSFEIIEKAISKQFSLTLKNGLVLTPVKMQKILKYKNRY